MLALEGKRFAIFGFLSERSLAYPIATQLLASGAEVAVTCLPSHQQRVEKLISKTGHKRLKGPFLCDFADKGSIKQCFSELATLGNFDGGVHGIAHSDQRELTGRALDTSLENFIMTMTISAYSLVSVVRHMLPLMQGKNRSIVALTFNAVDGTFPHYNAMGPAKAALETWMRYLATDAGEHNVRVNTVSASPANTPAARGIGDFYRIGGHEEAKSPLARRATPEEIAQAVIFLLSSYSSGITGQNIFVDCGASITHMPPVRNAPLMMEEMALITKTILERSESSNLPKIERILQLIEEIKPKK